MHKKCAEERLGVQMSRIPRGAVVNKGRLCSHQDPALKAAVIRSLTGLSGVSFTTLLVLTDAAREHSEHSMQNEEPNTYLHEKGCTQ